MKIKPGFVTRKVMDETVAVPTGEAAKSFHGMIKLNDTAAFIWSAIEEGLDEQGIADKLVAEYEGITAEKALADVNATIAKLREAGILED